MDHDDRNQDPDTKDREALGGRLSIGALSRATAIPIDTLRTWERRYGFPVPARRDSGHRVYSIADVARLRRIATALAMGVRAREAVSASEDQLDSLVHSLPTVPRSGARHRTTLVESMQDEFDAIFAALPRLDSSTLQRRFHTLWVRLGPIEFCSQFALPFVRELGAAWERGSVRVSEEHFFCEQLTDFLRVARIPLDDRANGSHALFATLPSEGHRIGIEIAAVIASSCGCRVTMLGTEVPAEDLAVAVKAAGANAVGIGISSFARGPAMTDQLRQLRDALPKRIQLFAGGAGAEELPGVNVFHAVDAFEAYCRRLAQSAS